MYCFFVCVTHQLHVPNNIYLTLKFNNYLILKRKQHTFGTFGQISKLQAKE